MPEGKSIQFNNESKWKFPAETVFIKNFKINDSIIETRLLIQHDEDEWSGYSYEWNENQNEAFLVGHQGKTKNLSNNQVWWYPSQSQCFRCHTEIAERVLGIDTAQMNRLFQYPRTGITANQIETFINVGLFENDLTNLSTESLVTFPNLNEETLLKEQSIEERARAYLHINCSMYHQLNGPGIGPADFRPFIPEKEMGICNVTPTVSDLGIEDAKLLTPQNIQKSILWQRMNTLNSSRMPPIGSNRIDEMGTELIKTWINQLDQCSE